MYSITKNFKFEASHRLMDMVKGHACTNLHGHSYVVKVTISTQKCNDSGMVIDFGKLKTFQIWLDEYYDHHTILNSKDIKLYNALKQFDFKLTILPINGDPTAENMAAVFYTEILHLCLINNISNGIIKIEVQETVGNSAIFEQEFKSI